MKKGGDNQWHEVSEKEALKKVSDALRHESLREKRKEKQGKASNLSSLPSEGTSLTGEEMVHPLGGVTNATVESAMEITITEQVSCPCINIWSFLSHWSSHTPNLNVQTGRPPRTWW